MNTLSALAPILKTGSTTKATKDEELKLLNLDTTDADAREFRSTFGSIEKAERIRYNTKTKEQKIIHERVLESLILNLEENVKRIV